MEENDFKRIEKMITTVVDSRLGKVEERLETRFQGVDQKFEMEQRFDAKFVQFRKEFRQEINEDFKHHVGVLTENFNHKLQIVAEGHQMLAEKPDRVEEKLEKKIDAVAIDLAAHRADTEGHKKGYRVREE